MYSSDPPYGQQPPAGGRAPAPASGSYGYNPSGPPASGGGYGYPPSGPAGGGGYGGGGGGYGGYDPGYGGVGGPESGGYGRSWGGPGGGGYGGGGRGGGGGGGGGRFAAVRLRGLPFGVREHEVAMFLGLDPIDILLTHRGGRATGEAFVVLSHPAEVDIAMRKNKAYMGSRYIEVFEARKADYYRGVADTVGDGGGGGGGGGHRGGSRGGGPGGSPRDRSRSPPARGRDRDRDGGHHPRDHGPVTSNIIKLRGLPFSAGVSQVLDFFDDPSLGLPTPLGDDDVVIATAGDGRPNGMAFVEFSAPEVAEIALRKDRHLMGSRYIELFVSDEDERARYLPVSGR